ncbi:MULTISPECIES: hypothetical protein [Bradyrhizobium]|jgi:predicted lysophospholipase L1 biosynthesis ABC-type transport system permease subunit|uniref:hypothetical protein n=1 Tax=Bradyrhizobium TaxID=374 RepID=UPI0012FD650D|nr:MULTISPECIES: hypothetical protein [Bradyrhizobium]MDI2110450.1 hypothetical protein [Bradyrhizobium sp. Mp64]WLB04500.1 hypothetical protein QNJ80_21910 [Bradyrhizobium elkanii]
MGQDTLAGVDVNDLRFLVMIDCLLLIAAFAAMGAAMQPFLDRRRDAGAGFRWVRR